MKLGWVHVFFSSHLFFVETLNLTNYNKNEAPECTEGKPLQIHLTAFFVDISSFDEISQSFDVEMEIRVQW